MTNQERLVRSQSILRRQNAGKITKWEASAEFDRLLDESSGDLHYYSDTTCLRADWDPRVMLFPHRDYVPTGMGPNGPTPPAVASNTGIITQGPDRGNIVTKPGEESDCNPETLAHFSKPIDRNA